MKLSKRLNKIVSMADKCDRIIDVGTDHGYAVIHLVENNICEKAIASDINKGPLKKAEINITAQKLSDKIECRLGGGLSVIQPKEVDGAIIAGMGGNLIRDIIEADIEVFKCLDYAVVQPVQNADVLREYIYNKGYKILDEDICKDENKYYEIIKVKYDNKPQKLNKINYEFSKNLINKNNPVFIEYMEYMLKKYEKIYSMLNEDTVSSKERKKELEYKISALKELLL